MPVFTEFATSYRDLRILPSRAQPLPRLKPTASLVTENFEVVVIGAGPSGLLLNLLLRRYGVDFVACFDAKPGTLRAGQADGLQPRTLEVFKSLGIADEILNDGCHMSEVAFWNAKPTPQTNGNGAIKNPGIERTSFVPDVNVAARYQHEVTIHQGRIERILKENLDQYGGQDTIRFSHRFTGFKFDEAQCPEYPILFTVEKIEPDGSVTQKSFRTKYLVGADGAHSIVRQDMDLKLEGETTDHIWGVVDFVADTDFPDIRKRCAIHSSAGSIMVIPRERIASGECLTRLYVQIADEVPEPDMPCDDTLGKAKSREKRAAVTLDYIMKQGMKVLAPYTIRVKEGTTVDWWAAYQIGQRMTPKSSTGDRDGVNRVFIVGDACHTHSPKAGQGMNVSMMDSYNLSWKLAHTLHNLIPISKSNENPVLDTFESERLNVARQLIDFDSKFSSMFSGQIGGEDESVKALTHEEFVTVFKEGSGFTSGCGIEYGDSVLVKHTSKLKEGPVTSQDPLNGTLHAGRRISNVKVRRYADANLRSLQDDFQSTGRYRVLVLASDDILDRSGRSATALTKICDIIQRFADSMIELVVLHPLKTRFEWTQIPSCVKNLAEMRFHGCTEENAYKIYGVPQSLGAIVIVRPDGVISSVDHLETYEEVNCFFSKCLVLKV